MPTYNLRKNDIQGTKVVQLLKLLSFLEIKRFKKFLASPFHNNNELLSQLFQLLKKHHPDYNSPKLTKESLYKSLFSNKVYHQQRMNDLMFDLRKLIENFLIVSNTLHDKKERQFSLTNILATRNHPSYIEASEKLIKKIEVQPTYLTGKDYLQLQKIYDQWWFHVDTDKNQNDTSTFVAAHENLDLFYVLTKLQYLAEQEGRKKTFKLTENINFKEAVLQYALNHKNPLLVFFYQVFQLIQGNLSIEEYHNLKENILAHGPKIPLHLKRDLLNHLLNCCIHKSNRGQSEYFQESLDLYKIMLDFNLLSIDGKIGTSHFLNISNLSIKCGEFEWGEAFRQDYSKFLDSKSRQVIISVAKIYILFHQKNFKVASEIINTEKFQSNNTYYPGIRVYLMKGLYRDWREYNANNAETLLNQTTAFIQYIKRNKYFSKEKNNSYLNFAKYFKQLVKTRRNYSTLQHSLKKLKMEVEEATLLTYKDWLLEEIQRMIK